MDITIGNVPPEGHPDRPSYLAMQSDGASLLVIGRQVTRAADPAKAVLQIRRELRVSGQ
jgi:orotidine-5'-phosphate decarboxylase